MGARRRPGPIAVSDVAYALGIAGQLDPRAPRFQPGAELADRPGDRRSGRNRVTGFSDDRYRSPALPDDRYRSEAHAAIPIRSQIRDNVRTISCGGASMDWYHQVQFVSAVAMPPGIATAFGTTVNGMWADPERMTAGDVSLAHEGGRKVLFSVPMIALIPRVDEAEAALLDMVCRDVSGEPAECEWYYWESKPVYAACIYGDAFREYLFS